MSVPDKEKLEAILSKLEQGNTDRINIRYTHKINSFNSKAIVSLGNEKFVFRSPVPHEEFVEKMKSMKVQDDRIQGIVFGVSRGSRIYFILHHSLFIICVIMLSLYIAGAIYLRKIKIGLGPSISSGLIVLWFGWKRNPLVKVEKFDPVQIQPSEVKDLLLLLAEDTARSAA
jgi:hypothetical protein